MAKYKNKLGFWKTVGAICCGILAFGIVGFSGYGIYKVIDEYAIKPAETTPAEDTETPEDETATATALSNYAAAVEKHCA